MFHEVSLLFNKYTDVKHASTDSDGSGVPYMK